jgi:hypothetical protein
VDENKKVLKDGLWMSRLQLFWDFKPRPSIRALLLAMRWCSRAKAATITPYRPGSQSRPAFQIASKVGMGSVAAFRDIEVQSIDLILYGVCVTSCKSSLENVRMPS